jgi:hypothetical protein
MVLVFVLVEVVEAPFVLGVVHVDLARLKRSSAVD